MIWIRTINWLPIVWHTWTIYILCLYLIFLFSFALFSFRNLLNICRLLVRVLIFSLHRLFFNFFDFQRILGRSFIHEALVILLIMIESTYFERIQIGLMHRKTTVFFSISYIYAFINRLYCSKLLHLQPYWKHPKVAHIASSHWIDNATNL